MNKPMIGQDSALKALDHILRHSDITPGAASVGMLRSALKGGDVSREDALEALDSILERSQTQLGASTIRFALEK